MNSNVSPKNWSGGGLGDDGVYMYFVLWEGNGVTEVHDMDVFIDPASTFDIATGIGASVTGII